MSDLLIRLRLFVKKWNYILTAEHKKKSVIVFIAILLSSLFELLGISMIIPFVTLLVDRTGIHSNTFLMGIIDRLGIDIDDNSIVLPMAIAVIAIFVFKDMFLILTEYLSLRYENRIQKDFCVFMINAYLQRPYEDTLDVNSAEVMRGIGNDVTALYYIIQAFFSLFTGVITVILVGLFLVKADPIMAISLVIIVGGLSGLILLALKGHVKRFGIVFNESMVESNKHALQALNGLKEILVLNRRSSFVKRYEDAVEKQRKAQLRYRFLQSLPRYVIETVFICGIIAFVSFRVIKGMDVVAFMPVLSAFAIASVRLLPLVNQISTSSTTILYYMPSFENAYANIKKSREYLSEIDQEKDKAILEYNEEIAINNVSWKYKRAEEPTFRDVNIRIKKGEAIGIKGPSGAGKTTLADVILGLLPPASGNIEIDGVDLANCKDSWSKLIGYVPQNVYLLDDTIRNNILFGISEEEYSEARVLEAINEACLSDFIKSLPDGLDTVVGERGTKLSGGQRQRIAIARVLYYNPQIIVLDEATSALDTDTEIAVMEAIERLQGQKTLIIIAHRLSTLAKCDRVFEVKDGKVEESKL